MHRALCLILLVGCAAEVESEVAAPVARFDAAVADVVYWLGVDLDGVTARDGGGWSTTTDLGYEIDVDDGWIAHRWITLGACTTARSHGGAGSAQSPPIDESLRVLEPQPVAAVALEPVLTACTAHHLIAGSDALDGATLVIDGRWRAPDGREGALALRTTTVSGDLVPLTSAIAAPLTLTVTVQRRPARFFDGVAFTAGDTAAEADAVLAAIHAATSIELVATEHIPH